ncbi:hypothetical protein ACI68E_004475 [Malassezia pachydermatis]
MTSISGAVALFHTVSLDVDALLTEIRQSDYLAELVSGESPVDESPLYHMVRSPSHSVAATTIPDVLASLSDEYAKSVYVVADDRTAHGDHSVQVVHVVDRASPRTLRAAPQGVLEVVCSLTTHTQCATLLAGGSLDEFQARCAPSDVYTP